MSFQYTPVDLLLHGRKRNRDNDFDLNVSFIPSAIVLADLGWESKHIRLNSSQDIKLDHRMEFRQQVLIEMEKLFLQVIQTPGCQ